VFVAKACIANFKADAHSLDFDIVLRLCIDASLGPIHIGECVDIYSQHVHIGFFTVEELTKLGFQQPVSGIGSMAKERAVAYVETGLSKKAFEGLQGQLERIK
jgi:hypothetical protein